MKSTQVRFAFCFCS